MGYQSTKISFIKSHIISKVIKKWVSISNYLDHRGFFYFDNPLIHNGRRIDRIGKGLLYFYDEIIPAQWGEVSGPNLLNAFNQLREKKFYIYKESEGRNYKVRMK